MADVALTGKHEAWRDNVLTKILDYQFNIQGRPIDTSGQNNHGVATATVASIGPGELRTVGFLSPTSRIDVPYRDCWSYLNAVQVEIRVSLSSLPHRVNLVEIERALALFIRKDGVVTFTFFAPHEPADPGNPASAANSFTALPPNSGSSDPFDDLVANPPKPSTPFAWQGVNTDAAFSPDGIVRTVPLNQYVTVRALHDGLASMRIYVNGELTGVRTDVTYGVPPLIAPGVVSIGAWPNDDRYTLNGSIDYVRIWREQPEFPYRQFFCRKMSAETEACWHTLFRTLADGFEDRQSEPAVRALLKFATAMQRGIATTIARAGEDARRELRGLSEAYLKQWCEGHIDGPLMQAHLRARPEITESGFYAWPMRDSQSS